MWRGTTTATALPSTTTQMVAAVTLLVLCSLLVMVTGVNGHGNGISGGGGVSLDEKVAKHRSAVGTSSIWNHQKAKLRYQSPESGNTGSAVATTMAEIDDNSGAWTHDRPLSELFFFPEICSQPEALNASTVLTIYHCHAYSL
jgi:hypothetical protein